MAEENENGDSPSGLPFSPPGWILDSKLPDELEDEVARAYVAMCDDEAAKMRAAGISVAEVHDMTVAVRSSATAEDLPNASFAGQQETYLARNGLVQ